MLKHLFSYEAKQLLRGTWYWMLLPLAIGLMYQFAFGSAMSEVQLEPAVVSLVNSENVNSIMLEPLNQIGTFSTVEDGNVVVPEATESGLPIVFVETTDSQARDLIDQDQIDAIVNVSEDDFQIHFDIEMAPSSINTTASDLIYYTLSSYQTTANNITQSVIHSSNPMQVGQEIMQIMEQNEQNNIVHKGNKEMNSQAVFFYAALGYVSTFFIIFGLQAVRQHDSFRSNEAVRQNLSPLPRVRRFGVTLITYWIPGLIVSYVLLFFYKSQGVPLGDSLVDLLILIALGMTAGYLTGVVIGSLFKLSESMDDAITVAMPLVFGAFAGMMFPGLKYFVDQTAPWLNRLNPVGLVSEGLYYLSHYPNKDKFYQNVLALMIYIAICGIVAYFGMRRDFHENI